MQNGNILKCKIFAILSKRSKKHKHPRVNSLKRFWSKFTDPFCKLGYFIIVHNFFNTPKWSRLLKWVKKFNPKYLAGTASIGQYYKLFTDVIMCCNKLECLSFPFASILVQNLQARLVPTRVEPFTVIRTKGRFVQPCLQLLDQGLMS